MPDEKDNSGSDSEDISSGPDDDNYVPEPVKVVPKPPPPRGPKGPKTPEQELTTKMKLAVHKIGAAVMSKEDMDKLWSFTGEEKYEEILKTTEIQNLISDKLRHCAALGNLSSIEYLSSKGGDINAPEDFTGNTPLMIATGVTKDFDKQKEVIRFLMENGADCNIKNKYGLTPKSAIPGFKDSPLVIYVREMDLKMKDKRKSQTK